MASDIFNVAGTGTGLANMGRATVHSPRAVPDISDYSKDTPTLKAIDISTITSKYDTRFDDVGYYSYPSGS